MKIGNFDIADVDARQWTVVFGYSDIKSKSEWGDGMAIPYFTDTTHGFKTMKITIMIDGTDRQDLLQKRSLILSKCLKPCEYTLDKYDRTFLGVLKKHSGTELIMKRKHKLTLEIECIEQGEISEVDIYRQTRAIIQCNGNIDSPCTLEIIPVAGISSLTLTGLCRNAQREDLPIVITNLVPNQKIVINGPNGLLEHSGNEVLDLWGIPMLVPGENIITSDSDWIDLKVIHRPRYF